MADFTLDPKPKHCKLIPIDAIYDINRSSSRNDIATYELPKACEHDEDPLQILKQKKPAAHLSGGRN
ncbi:hypothetical protein [Lichenicoccus sp.]|uniref:hypothetical protein n=1 Tax=Lichenicoccus sp. TaxID=2781899 RepID=UPI003D0F5575